MTDNKSPVPHSSILLRRLPKGTKLCLILPERKIKCCERKRRGRGAVVKVVFHTVSDRMGLRCLGRSRLFSKPLAESFLSYSHQTGVYRSVLY